MDTIEEHKPQNLQESRYIWAYLERVTMTNPASMTPYARMAANPQQGNISTNQKIAVGLWHPKKQKSDPVKTTSGVWDLAEHEKVKIKVSRFSTITDPNAGYILAWRKKTIFHPTEHVICMVFKFKLLP